MNAEINELLERLANVRAAQDAIRLSFAEMREKILTPEIRAQLAEIDAEEQTALKAAADGEEQLTNQVKALVIANGATVKGTHLQAVYAAGRVSWDTKALDGYAAAHPEITPFRKVGEPSVSIREVK